MSECLSVEALRRYAAGTLAGEELQCADAHVFACASCRAQLLDPSLLARAEQSLAGKVRWNPRIEFNCLDDEQASAYVEGTLDATDRELVESHLELCPLCIEDLRSLRAFRAEMSTYPARVYGPALAPEGRRQKAEDGGREAVGPVPGQDSASARPPALQPSRLPTAYCLLPTAFWRLPKLRVALQTAGAAALALLVLFWTAVRPLQTQLAALQREKSQLRQANTTLQQINREAQRRISASEALRTRLARLEEADSQIRHQYQAARTASAEMRARLARLEQERKTAAETPGGRSLLARKDEGASVEGPLGLPAPLPRDLAAAFTEWAKQGKVTPKEPARRLLAQLPAESVPIRGGAAEGERAEPVAPMRTFILSVRPEFEWEPAVAATGYVVSLEDPAGRELWQKEASANDTRLPFPADRPALRPGKSYRWKVEARFANGDRSPSRLAAFRVLEEPRLREVSRLKLRYARFPAVWAAFCQKEGLYDEAKRALQQLLGQNRPPTSTIPPHRW